MLVVAFDEDVVSDDFLGACGTDREGRLEVRFTDDQFKDAFESRPDIYLCVFAPVTDQPVVDTSSAIRRNAAREEHYEIEIQQPAWRWRAPETGTTPTHPGPSRAPRAPTVPGGRAPARSC